jgi:hypothetical protein
VHGPPTGAVPVRSGVPPGAAILCSGRGCLPELLPLLLAILVLLPLVLRAILPRVRSWAVCAWAGMRSAGWTCCGAGRGIGRLRRSSSSGVHVLRKSRRTAETRAQQQRKHTPGELEFSAHATLHLLIRRTRIILLLR